MAGIISGLLGLLGCKKQARKDYAVADVYQGLRQQVLDLDPTQFGLDSSSSNRVWGILMETGYPEAVVTLVAIADGTVSLYFSNGGGIIGVGQHEEPRKAGLALLSTAPAFLQQLKRTEDFPLPEEGHTLFYFMTYDGIFTADAVEDDLGNDRSPLSPLFYKAQDVITQARLADAKRQESTGRMLHAATTDDTEGLSSMLDAGVPVDIADDTGLTPLMASSHAGKSQALRFLLDSGAQIDASDASGYTALMFACNSGQVECAELLIEGGADINHRDKDSSTPIMFAAQHANNELVRILLAQGADPEFKGKHGLSAIGFAQQNGHSETEKILKDGK